VIELNPSPASLDPNRESVLLVHEDETTRTMLTNFLSEHFNVEAVASGEDAMGLILRYDKFNAVICTVEMKAMDGINFAAIAKREHPHLKFVLLTDGRVEERLPQLHKHRLLNVLITTKPFNFDDLMLTVENVIRPERAFGLRRYLREPMLVRDRIVRSTADKIAAVDDALRFFRNYRQYEDELNDIRLGFEELINNCIFHAFRHADGTEKYRAGLFATLVGGEQIDIEYGRDNACLGCCVTDNQGVLDPDVVLTNMERQLTKAGLMDERGRGIHLTRTLCDKMILNIDVGRRTQFVLLFMHRAAPRAKPLHINVLDNRAPAARRSGY
jgi:CheY-like chemotaxis protein